MPFGPTVIWLLAGVGFCLVELLLPTAFVASMMGVSAFIVALISLVLPQLSWQIILWMAISVALVVLVQRWVPKQKASAIADATEAETLTEILPGKTGRVLYEGNSWQAQCDDETLAIAPQQKVCVVGRKSTTLLVMPENLLHH
ncbi:NfeD family protein [Trichocoleus sp. FACHB-262]|uniref:NfeD family protein n=1 Tax=Trichocoleus sp. FACHB-262 TaxID=2692869 RepID=UPI0016893083|nr:NfeD family protein [Trichocoleus sp. FACHB-262]MBD2124097.1 NfeD family protein [Trichocoleus sp. FACHB-262]